LTNDDGIYAPGLRALHRALRAAGHDVTLVAPASEQSAVGHSITLFTPLVVQEVREEGELLGYAVEGKPADCVKLGLVELLPTMPDLVVSGINAGSNAGINVLYSGTVAAAIEGAFFQTTSIALSLQTPESGRYERAAEIGVRMVHDLVDRKPAKGALFNVNIPDLTHRDPIGVRVARQGLTCYREAYESRIDPRGRRYYWLLPDELRGAEHLDDDLTALAAGYITVTPLQFDLTERRRLDAMQEWTWTL
ncbi:MAG: 5'/3'-nucleotidase SurE, partial [Planctomycetia bacterium]